MTKSKTAIMILILKRLKDGKLVCSTDFDVSEYDFVKLCAEIQDEGYIKGFVEMGYTKGDDPDVLANVDITIKGEEYLSKIKDEKLDKIFSRISDGASLAGLVTQIVSLGLR